MNQITLSTSIIEDQLRYKQLLQEAKSHRLRQQVNQGDTKYRARFLTKIGNGLILLGEWLKAGNTALTHKPLAR